MSRLIRVGVLVTVATVSMLYSHTATLIASMKDRQQLQRAVAFERTTYRSSQRRKTIRHVVRNKQNPLEIVQEVVIEKKQTGETEGTEDAETVVEEDDSTKESKSKTLSSSEETNLMSKQPHSEDSDWPMPRVTNESTVILVLSARSHIELRQVIRETWGNGHDNVYFVIGQYCPVTHKNRKHSLTCEHYPGMNETKNGEKKNNTHDEWYQKRMKMEDAVLRQEQEHFRDMLWTPSPESYRGLPHKLKEGYHWIIQNVISARWIVKADDDTVVRVGALGKYLVQLDSSIPTIIGNIQYESFVHHEGRWKEEKYGRDIYPPFPLGSCGHVVSRPVAQYISQHKDSLTEYQGEDTSLGIWMSESKLSPVEVLHSGAFENTGRCESPNLFIIGHDLSADRIRECYKIGDEVEPIAAWQ